MQIFVKTPVVVHKWYTSGGKTITIDISDFSTTVSPPQFGFLDNQFGPIIFGLLSRVSLKIQSELHFEPNSDQKIFFWSKTPAETDPNWKKSESI